MKKKIDQGRYLSLILIFRIHLNFQVFKNFKILAIYARIGSQRLKKKI